MVDVEQLVEKVILKTLKYFYSLKDFSGNSSPT